jgi:hypothetical protein
MSAPIAAFGSAPFGGSGEEEISGSSAFVAMMESANFGKGDDIALLRRLNSPKLRGIFVQRIGWRSIKSACSEERMSSIFHF